MLSRESGGPELEMAGAGRGPLPHRAAQASGGSHPGSSLRGLDTAGLYGLHLHKHSEGDMLHQRAEALPFSTNPFLSPWTPSGGTLPTL